MHTETQAAAALVIPKLSVSRWKKVLAHQSKNKDSLFTRSVFLKLYTLLCFINIVVNCYQGGVAVHKQTIKSRQLKASRLLWKTDTPNQIHAIQQPHDSYNTDRRSFKCTLRIFHRQQTDQMLSDLRPAP